LFLDPLSTLIMTGIVAVVVSGFLVWLALIPMEE
jgi:hypothetical protein